MRLIVALILLWLASPVLADGILMNTTGSAGAGGGGGGGGGGPPFATWDPTFNTTCFTYSNGNLTAAFKASCIGSNGATRTTTSYSSTAATAKVYFEITPTFTTGSGSPTNIYVGFSDAGTLAGGAPAGGGGVAYQPTGTQNFTVSGPPGVQLATWTSGTVIAYAIDFTARKVWTKAGCAGLWNSNFNSPGEDPATGVGGWGINNGTDWTPSGALWASFSDGFNSLVNSAVLNDGASAFACTIPSGYVRW